MCAHGLNRPFIAFIISKLDLAMICHFSLSFETSGSAWIFSNLLV